MNLNLRRFEGCAPLTCQLLSQTLSNMSSPYLNSFNDRFKLFLFCLFTSIHFKCLLLHEI